jgi:hypothetical protein
MKGSQTRDKKSDALYCAAQAVVAIRLGLPLLSVDLVQGTVQRDGYLITKSASADLVPGTAQRWQEALSDPASRQGLTNMASMAAAACIAEDVEGRHPGDIGGHDAVRQIKALALALGIPASEVPGWVAARISDAHALLRQDEGAAWDRVRIALKRKGRLTAAEVRSLVR